jgi:hypothetical protein
MVARITEAPGCRLATRLGVCDKGMNLGLAWDTTQGRRQCIKRQLGSMG